jgi:hypothetical protein
VIELLISSQQLKQLEGTLREDSLELNRINNFSIACHPTAREGYGPATTAFPRTGLLARNDLPGSRDSQLSQR